MRPSFPLFTFLALVGLEAACSPDNPGVSPPPAAFHFPIAAAVSPDSKFLYVVNSDFNLEYNGGTVNVVRLDAVREAIAGCRGSCPVDTNRNAEAAYVAQHGGTVRINPFATDAALVNDPATGRSRLYVTVRGDGTVTWIDLVDGGSTLSCGTATPAELCAPAHRIGADPSRASPRMLTLPQLPVSLSAAPDGFIAIAHQEAPQSRLSLIYDPPAEGGTPVLAHWVGELVRNASAVLRVDGGGDTGRPPRWYVFSRDEPTVGHVLAFADGPRSFLYQARATTLRGVASDTGIRAVVRDPRPERRRAFATVRPGATMQGRTPAAAEQLMAIDFTDLDEPQVTDVLELPPGPSRLVAIVDPGETGHTLVYAVSYDAREVYVVDADDWRPVTQIRTQLGPHALVADPSLAPGHTGPVHPYLYLVNFLSACVEVIDVDPRSPTYHRVVFTIGDPTRPRESL